MVIMVIATLQDTMTATAGIAVEEVIGARVVVMTTTAAAGPRHAAKARLQPVAAVAAAKVTTTVSASPARGLMRAPAPLVLAAAQAATVAQALEDLVVAVMSLRAHAAHGLPVAFLRDAPHRHLPEVAAPAALLEDKNY